MVTTQAFPFRCEIQAFLLLKANSLETETLWQTLLLLSLWSELFIKVNEKNSDDKILL